MPTRLLVAYLLFCSVMEAQNPLTTSAQRYFTTVRRNLEATADAMPADQYGFRLTEGQMTFAEWLNHSTQRNFSDCAILKGESAPAAAARSASLKEKAEVSQALKESFAYCAEAFKTLDDSKAAASPQVSNAFLHVVVHNNEIYGNVVGYLRLKGIVPPSTAARQSPKSDKK